MGPARGPAGAADAPATDADVPAFWRSLGLPGLIDLHVHFMPDRVLRKVWAYFDRLGSEGARDWPITYRGSDTERLRHLRAMGVRAFTSLSYPHRPDMAAWLNEWSAGFAAAQPDVLPSGTFYPEPSAKAYVADALAGGVAVWKAHLQVGAYDPRDPLLDDVWGTLAQARTPVVVHCGSGPEPGAFTGPGPIGEVLRRHPSLVLVVAHLGMPEYAAFLDLAGAYDGVHLDTTMAFTDYVEAAMPFPRALVGALADLRAKIVLGTDFPNIPHTYAHQLAALARLDLGDDWLRAVCHDNALRLLP